MDWRWAFGLVVVIGMSPWACLAEEPEEPDDPGEGLPLVEIVLFTPSDVSPPAEADASLRKLAESTEKFFVSEMTSWGYEPARKQFFSRDDQGVIQVRHVAGDMPAASGAYDTHGFEGKVKTKVLEQYKLPRNGNVVWIFVSLGPGREFKKWVGLGAASFGGQAIVRYSPGGVFPNPQGHLHEFGHALGLFHMGPRLKDKLTCNMMGAGGGQIEKRLKRDCGDRFCLEEASAAMLWKHPIFSGTVKDRKRRPQKVELADYKAEFDSKKRATTVTGRIVSDLSFHSVVVVDDAVKGQEGYWHKAYVARAGEDGSFSVIVAEPTSSDGTLMIVPCFDNGRHSANKKWDGNMALSGAIKKPYTWNAGRYRFEK